MTSLLVAMMALSATVAADAKVAPCVGRVEGIAMKGGEPWPFAPIRLHSEEWPNEDSHDVSYETHADAKGLFYLDDVRCGEYGIGILAWFDGRRGKSQDPSRTNAVQHHMYVDSGKPNRVQLGGPGRTVRGRFVAPKGWEGRIGWQSNAYIRLFRARSEAARPPANLSTEENEAWLESFKKSPDYRKHRDSAWAGCYQINADGTFVAVHVPAGVMHFHGDFWDIDGDRYVAQPPGVSIEVDLDDSGDLNLGDIEVVLRD